MIKIGVLILAIVLVVIGPLLLIWSINTLFPAVAIQYTINTWLAALVVLLFFKESSVTISK